MAIDVNLNLKTVGGQSIIGAGDIPIPPSEINIDVTPIINGQDKGILFQDDDKVSQSGHFTWDNNSLELLITDNNNDVAFAVNSSLEVAPGVEIPFTGVSYLDAIHGVVDGTSVGLGHRAFMGWLGEDFITIKRGGNIHIETLEDIDAIADKINLSSQDHINLECGNLEWQLDTIDGIRLFDGINYNHQLSHDGKFSLGIVGNSVVSGVYSLGQPLLGFYGQSAIARQSLSLGSSTDDIINVLQNLGLTTF